MGCGLTVNDVLRNHVEKTIQNNPGWFTPHQQRVLHRLADDGEYVTIRVKSYRKKCHETLRMTGEEFVKRFAPEWRFYKPASGLNSPAIWQGRAL